MKRKKNNHLKILISRIGMLGDTLCTLPVLRNLRKHYPEAEITMIVSTAGTKLLHAIFPRQKLITYNIYHPKLAKLNLRINLFGQHYDHFYNLDTSDDYHAMYRQLIKSSCWFRMVKALDPADQSVQYQQVWADTERHVVAQYLELLKLATIPIAVDNYAFESSEDIRLTAASFRKMFKKRNPNRRLVGIHPGNNFLNTNFIFRDVPFEPRAWSVEHYIELCRLINRDIEPITVVLTGSFFERKLTKVVAATLREKGIPVFNMAGGTTRVPQLMGLLRALDLYICGDTGPMHLASALGVPLVAIFCSPDPKDSGPYGDPTGNIVVNSDISCHPCDHTDHQKQCPPDNNCVLSLTPAKVMNMAKPFIELNLQRK